MTGMYSDAPASHWTSAGAPDLSRADELLLLQLDSRTSEVSRLLARLESEAAQVSRLRAQLENQTSETARLRAQLEKRTAELDNLRQRAHDDLEVRARLESERGELEAEVDELRPEVQKPDRGRRGLLRRGDKHAARPPVVRTLDVSGVPAVAPPTAESIHEPPPRPPCRSP